jgi:integrase
MRGSVRRRRDGAYWEYVVEAGMRTRWVCPVDRCRFGTWSPGEARDGCPRHDGRELEETVRRRQLSRSGFTRKRDAEKAMRAALVDLDDNRVMPAASLTLGDYLAREWLPAVETTVKPTTFAQYRQLVTTHVLPRIGAVALRDLETAHLDRLYAELLREGRRDGTGGLSAKTVRHVHVALRKALGDALRKGRVARNVAEHASPPKPRKPRPRVWTADQLRAFLEATADDRLAAAWVLVATTGINRGELLGLAWDSVDLEAGAVTIAAQLTLADGQPVDSDPKTDRRRRTISLDPDTLADLRAHAARQQDEILEAGSLWQETGLVFTREDGSPIHPERLSRRFKTLTRRAMLPHIGLHGLRHTYATIALASGVPAKVVSERLGHASTSITMDIYQHVMPGMDADAATKVAAIIRGTA